MSERAHLYLLAAGLLWGIASVLFFEYVIGFCFVQCDSSLGMIMVPVMWLLLLPAMLSGIILASAFDFVTLPLFGSVTLLERAPLLVLSIPFAIAASLLVGGIVSALLRVVVRRRS